MTICVFFLPVRIQGNGLVGAPLVIRPEGCIYSKYYSHRPGAWCVFVGMIIDFLIALFLLIATPLLRRVFYS